MEGRSGVGDNVVSKETRVTRLLCPYVCRAPRAHCHGQYLPAVRLLSSFSQLRLGRPVPARLAPSAAALRPSDVHRLPIPAARVRHVPSPAQWRTRPPYLAPSPAHNAPRHRDVSRFHRPGSLLSCKQRAALPCLCRALRAYSERHSNWLSPAVPAFFHSLCSCYILDNMHINWEQRLPIVARRRNVASSLGRGSGLMKSLVAVGGQLWPSSALVEHLLYCSFYLLSSHLVLVNLSFVLFFDRNCWEILVTSIIKILQNMFLLHRVAWVSKLRLRQKIDLICSQLVFRDLCRQKGCCKFWQMTLVLQL